VISVGVVGASGYTGGEVLRILLRHPQAQIAQATSESNAGHYVYAVHPNLRKQTPLKFTTIGELKPCDVLFLCLPHGSAMRRIGQLESIATTIIDLSADFRLRCPDDYPTWYGHPHDAPQYLERFRVRDSRVAPQGHRLGALHHGRRLPCHGVYSGADAALQTRRLGKR